MCKKCLDASNMMDQIDRDIDLVERMPWRSIALNAIVAEDRAAIDGLDRRLIINAKIARLARAWATMTMTQLADGRIDHAIESALAGMKKIAALIDTLDGEVSA